jgi:hypothetical protein
MMHLFSSKSASSIFCEASAQFTTHTGMAALALIQSPSMANWRQIQGRIRRARSSADPVAKLNELFQKTRDAMVAFEAAALEEKSGRSDEAVRWYTIAAQRFRRADWRQKAAEALTRLGAPVPEATAPLVGSSTNARDTEENGETETVAAAANSQADAEENGEAQPADSEVAERVPSATNAPARTGQAAPRTGRRRGRRGGRRHRRPGARSSAASTQTHAHTAAHSRQAQHGPSAPPIREEDETAVFEPVREVEAEAARSPFVAEPSGPLVERVTYIRAGDPALASRFAHLESLLRRLISAPLHRVDELEEAPAGPGVFLLSDSDLMTNYYVEACQTLRIGTSQLARAGRAGRGARTEGKASLRSQMAEHLEINETQVSDYLKKHCVVRWLQLDEDAPRLAHFAIALLRPALNVD